MFSVCSPPGRGGGDVVRGGGGVLQSLLPASGPMSFRGVYTLVLLQVLPGEGRTPVRTGGSPPQERRASDATPQAVTRGDFLVRNLFLI